ncbi:hypothetical protein [Thalassospira lucentensis]|uniref:hypothetical protein n=1 Tax=Thalassospira lucentensis TaxID=168935 RepID=UPI003AA9D594
MPVSDRPLSLRRFALWVGIGALLAISSIATLNIFVDPLGRFGFAYKFWFNTHYSSVSALNLRTLYTEPYIESMGKRQTQTYLLGTSRFMVGFDTCNIPRSQKLSVGGAGLTRLVEAQNILLAHAQQPTTIIVEAAGLNADAQKSATSTPSFLLKGDDLLVSLFGNLTTVTSLKTLVLNVSTSRLREASPDCSPQPVSFHGVAKSEQEKRFIASINDLKIANTASVLREAWHEAISSVEELCHSQGLRHKIRWVMLPMSENYWKRPFQQESRRRLQQVYEAAIQSDRPYPGACDISFTSFIPEKNSQESKLWKRQDLWEDYIHFSPVLGKLVLKEMVETAAQKP